MESIISLPSVEGMPTLEPIPGSEAPTPLSQTRRNSPEHEIAEILSSPDTGVIYLDASSQAGPSRSPWIKSRESSNSYLPIPGSYFPPAEGQSAPNSPPSIYRSFPPTPSAGAPAPSPSAGASAFGTGTQTPSSDRPRPAPLEMPAGTVDDPLFSAYPSAMGEAHKDKGKGKAFSLHIPLRSAFHFIDSPHRRRSNGMAQAGTSSLGSSGSSSPVPKPGRRRAATVSHSPPMPIALFQPLSPDLDRPRRHTETSIASDSAPDSPSRVSRRNSHRLLPIALKRRRASIGSKPFGTDFSPPAATEGQWPSMPHEEAKRMDPHRALPFAYNQPGMSNYTIESVSTLATVRPLASPVPAMIAPRRSSLSSPHAVHVMSPSSPIAAGLGLSNVSLPSTDVPPTPPPRRSSLSFGPDTVIDIKPLPPTPSLPGSPATAAHEATSVLSASLTTTEESTSAEFFSPTLSNQHPLSSATTSLSRSAKSGKEKEADGAQDSDGMAKHVSTSLTALRLQRSLDWEAKQTRHRRRLEKRKMILLELVETEVTYAEDLRLLVQVYLPQLAALPSVTQKMALLVGRNAAELLVVHSGISVNMVEVLRDEGLGYSSRMDEELEGRVEKVSRRLAALLVENATRLSAYNAFCAGSVSAASIVRNISLRTDYEAFERRCQIICASFSAVRLQDLLEPDHAAIPATNRSRLHFRDYLIMPIQRVCRYPLLLGSLLGSVDTPCSPAEGRGGFDFGDTDYDVGVDVERALGAMRGVAEEADEARRLREAEVRSNIIAGRIEPHHAITPAFLKMLGTCRLIGSLDVLHHHPTLSPLVPPVKIKYMAAFLYKGYLVLAKVKKTKTYEVKHFLPLEVFELIDITEGFLPHSIRLTLREHNFDLAASCAAEKEVWASALIGARDESTIPPFELPASVSPFATKARRMSNAALNLPPLDLTLANANQKRHTVAVYPESTDAEPLGSESPPATSPVKAPSTVGSESASRLSIRSPISSFSPFSQNALAHAQAHGSMSSTTLLLRRATASQRLIVDRALLDVFSEACAQARSKAQLHHSLFLPDSPHRGADVRDKLSMRDSTVLRRRRSFLDGRSRASTMDIAFSGEVKGSVMDRPKSMVGSKRNSMVSPKTHIRSQTTNSHSRRASVSHTQSEMESGREDDSADADGADDTATATGASDFGTLRAGTSREYGTWTRATSVASTPPATDRRPMARRSLSLFRPNFDVSSSSTRLQTLAAAEPVTEFVQESTPLPVPGRMTGFQKSVRRTASALNLTDKARRPINRAKSTPVSPALRPVRTRDSQGDGVKRALSDPTRLEHAHPVVHDEPDSIVPLETIDVPPKPIEKSNARDSAEFTSSVYPLGNGFTNTPERTSWTGSIRRGVSMLKSRGDSVTNLQDMAQNALSVSTLSLVQAPVGVESGKENETSHGDAPPPVPPKDGIRRNNSSGFLSQLSEGTTRHTDDDDKDRVDTTPKRRRSVKLLQSLRGFTPI